MPVLFASRWNADAQAWRSDDPDDIPTMSDAVQFFADEVRQRSGGTRRPSWSRYASTGTSARQQRHGPIRWVQRLNEHLRERDIKEAQESIEYLNQELEKTTVIEIQQGIFRLIEQQIEGRDAGQRPRRICVSNSRSGQHA